MRTPAIHGRYDLAGVKRKPLKGNLRARIFAERYKSSVLQESRQDVHLLAKNLVSYYESKGKN